MRKFSVFSTLVATLAAIASTAAYADGAPERYAAPVVLTPTSWTGLYVGVQGGYGWGDTDWTFPFDEFFNTAPGQGFSLDPEGGVVGGHVTLNYQLGPLVVGGEVAFNGTMMDDDRTGGVSPLFPNDRFETSIDNYLTLTGRLGFATDKWLLYADGGYATAKVDLNAVSGVPVAGVIANTDNRHDGWTVGGGLAYMIDPHVVLGVEYEYLKFDGERHQTTTTGTVVGLPFSVDSGDIELQVVTARLSIKLDRDLAPVPLK